jgi:HEAT repeat protein
MKQHPARWRLRTLMGLVLAVAVGIRLYQKSQEASVAQRLLSFDVQLGGVDPKKLFTEAELVAALGNSNPAVRAAACWALDNSGSKSPALVPVLVGLLETESEEDRWQNRRSPRQIHPAASLIRIKVPAPTLATVLAPAMASKDRWVRLCAGDVLRDAARRPGPTDPGVARLLLAALWDEEARNRTLTAEALAQCDPPTRRQTVAILLEQFRGAKPPRAFEAVVGLARFDPEAQAAARILADRLQTGDAPDQFTNLYLLKRLGPVARPAVPAVVRVMSSRDAERFQPDALSRFRVDYTGWHSAWRSWLADKYLNSPEHAHTPSNLRDLGAAVLARIGPEAEKEAVDALRRMLKSDDEAQLLGAVEALKAIGAAAAPALPDLIALSAQAAPAQPGKHRHALMRAIAGSIDRVGQGSPELVVEALVGMLKSAEPASRVWAAQTLNQLKPPPRSALPALIAAMNDATQGVRFAAALALGRYDGPDGAAAVPALLAAMNDEDVWVRVNSGKSLARHGEAARAALPELIHLLRSMIPTARDQVAQALGDFGPVAGEATAALLEALNDEWRFVRETAAKALTRVSPSVSATVEEALDILNLGDVVHRRRALCDLARAPADAQAETGAAAVSAGIRNALMDPDPTVRATAAAALGYLGQHSESATAAVIAALRDASEAVRIAAATALGRIAPGEPDAAHALARVLQSPCAELRRAAAAALGRMGPVGAPALIQAIDDPDAAVRIQVIAALGHIGPAEGVTIPPLLAAAKDRSAPIRSAAFEALGRIGQESDVVIPALIAGLDDDGPAVRFSAGSQLGKIRPPGRVLPALLEVLDRGSARARAQAARAVGGLGPEAMPAALSVLVRALKDQDEQVRSGAAHAFWRLGAASAPAAPALRAALDDPSHAVRNDASGALMLIEARRQR